jgi:hypothetical protein
MKRILTILCALAIVMAGSATALAAEPAEGGQSASYYPISVEEYTYGDFDELRINKTLPVGRSQPHPHRGLHPERTALLPAGHDPEG